jgi:hypothetical protein
VKWKRGEGMREGRGGGSELQSDLPWIDLGAAYVLALEKRSAFRETPDTRRGAMLSAHPCCFWKQFLYFSFLTTYRKYCQVILTSILWSSMALTEEQ